MKRFLQIPMSVLVFFGVFSCNRESTEVDMPNDPVVDLSDSSVDLSADATANCYIISSAGTYKFNATVMGNGAATEGLTPSVLSPEGAKLVWQTSVGMISEVEYSSDGYIKFTADGTYGNALLAALDGEGEIIWSWHIWSCGLDLEPYTTKTGYELMPINLGATSKDYDEANVAQSYGLLYQWGRKDPFPNASTPTGDTSTVGGPVYDADGNEVSILYSSWYDTNNNTLEYSIANPTTCLSNYSHYSSSRDWLAAEYTNDALWGNPYGNQRDAENNWQYTGEKSIYDPCPVGWMVPPPGVFSTFTTTGNYTWDYSSMDIYDINGDGEVSEKDFMYGWHFMTEDGELFFPAAGRYDGSYSMLYGSVCGLWGAYWSNSPALESIALADGMAFCPLAFAVNQVSPSASASRADAYSVRCIREL